MRGILGFRRYFEYSKLMKNKIIKQLRKMRRKFKKICNTLITSHGGTISETLSKIFRRLNKQESGINGKTLFNLFESIIEPNFWLKLGNNTIYKLKDYFNFIIFLSSFNLTPEGGTQLLKSLSVVGPNADTFLYHLKKFTRKEIMELVEKLNQRIFQEAKRFLRHGVIKKAFKVAIDFTDRPYYGKKSTPSIVGGKQKASTNWFYRFAAITIIEKGVRFTLAMAPVLPFDEDVEIVDWLIKKAEKVIRIKIIEMDRGFFKSKIINYLIKNRYKFLMPAIKNKRIKKQILSFHQNKSKQCIQYRFYPSRKNSKDYEFNVFFVKNESEWTNLSEIPRTEKDILKLYHVYATNKVIRNRTNHNLKKIAAQYKERWGVETAFKMINFFQIRTSSRIFIIRLFCYLFSMVIYNLWILYNLLYKCSRENRYILPSFQLKLYILVKSLQYWTQIIMIQTKNIQMEVNL